MTVGPGAYAVLSAIVFAIGIYGLLARRHPLAVLIAVCLMFAAPVIALLGFTHVFTQHFPTGPFPRIPPLGDALSAFGIVVATCIGSVGFALLLLLWRRTGRADIDSLGDVES